MCYINKDTNKKFLFFKVPIKILNDEPYKSKMTHTSILGYILILNRVSLSRLNNWYDENGDIYIYYSIYEMMKDLNISKSTTLGVFKILEELGLIGYKEKLKGKTSKIYVKDIFEDEYKVVQKLDHTGIKFIPQLVQKLYPNNIYYNNNKNKYNNKGHRFQNYEQREYDDLESFYDNI